MDLALYKETVPLPRAARFPVELRPPDGFNPSAPETWPHVDGRLEYVEGRLLYMGPCADTQQDVATQLTLILGTWAEGRAELVVGSNEAGMTLGGETRAADAAVWRREDLPPGTTGKFRRVPPVLAAEVAGEDDEGEQHLREKARWYLAHGVKVVWIVLTAGREVVVLREGSERRYRTGMALPEEPELVGLSPAVDRFFAKLGPPER